MKTPLSLLLAAVLSTLTLPANSHHSFPGAYDVGEMLFMEGVVTNFMFRNPHSFIFMDVKQEDGTTESWHLELPPSWALTRFGVVKDFIKVDDELLVSCNPSWNGTNSCGVGQKTGFYRHSDTYLYGKDPRKAMAAMEKKVEE
jgi:hypothetical protein